ncbi:MAG TPA: hypothetical protein VFJ16_13110 [Longimicrobium sp.]|nr:hypothetical protein [Longimicrobium sp.]
MGKALMIAAAVVLGFHGLIHLMGTVAYCRLGEIDGLPYRTTLLGGRLDVGDGGMMVVGLLWAVAAAGLVTAAAGWLAGWNAWTAVLIPATLLSLVLTALDWSMAFRGTMVDVAILALVWIGPRMMPSLAAG